MERYQYHIVYKTTNTVNNRSYVGLHSTNNLNDRYLGSGWILKDAIKKYGRDSFMRTILHVCDTREEARHIEASIVTQEYIESTDTYNLTPGGMGVEDQWGARNHRYGKLGTNAKSVRATHTNGTVLLAPSINALQEMIGIDRANIRVLIKKQIRGRRGWKVEEVG